MTREEAKSGDLISRQAVLDIINFEDKWLLDAKGHNADTEIAFSGMKSRIAELPSVNPQEPKTGHWIDQYNDGNWHCSKCGAIVEKDEQINHNWYFCYHCGCRMVEPRESEDANANQHNSNALNDVGQHTNALEGDLISRQAVNEIINDIRDCISVEGYCAILERLKKIPPVNPQEPKTDVLDEIKAEIKQLPYQRIFGKVSNYSLLDVVIEIIDKYRAESEDKCKNCKYYRNPDYTRCHKCEAESEDKE